MAIPFSLSPLRFPSFSGPRSFPSSTLLASLGLLRPRFVKRFQLSSLLPGLRAIKQDEALSSGSAEEEEELERRLQELGDSLNLPDDYLGKLPHDLRVDLDDAAFALSSGSLDQECGKQVAEMLMQLSRSWEQADTQASRVVSKSISYLHHSLPNNLSCRAAIGRRFLNSGEFLAATGQYGQGELQEIGNALIAAGKALSTSKTEATDANDAVNPARKLKFGDMQVELTPTRAFIGSTIAFFFGILSWKLASTLQSIPQSSMNYANDNAVLLAYSLRGALITLGYSSAALSALAMFGLTILGIRWTSSEK